MFHISSIIIYTVDTKYFCWEEVFLIIFSYICASIFSSFGTAGIWVANLSVKVCGICHSYYIKTLFKRQFCMHEYSYPFPLVIWFQEMVNYCSLGRCLNFVGQTKTTIFILKYLEDECLVLFKILWLVLSPCFLSYETLTKNKGRWPGDSKYNSYSRFSINNFPFANG